ncbi:MAG: SBBP repeat-containing protein, partial [Chitinophagaceae bacterium]
MFRFLSDPRRLFLVVFALISCSTLLLIIFWQLPQIRSTVTPKTNFDVSKDNSNTNQLHANSNFQVAGNYLPSSNLVATDVITEQAKANILEQYGQLPLHFEPNQGQINTEEVKFISRGNGYQTFLSATEAVLSLHQSPPPAHTVKQTPQDKIKRLKKKTKTGKPAIVTMQIIGANKEASSTGIEQLEGKSNYFFGNDSAKWKTDVPNYKRVQFDEVYEGIDLQYYGNQRQLEYDFVVKPGADPEQIKLQFKGVSELSVNNEGELILKTKLGELKQKKPFIYQTTEDGSKQEVAGSYKVTGQKVSFDLVDYDTTKELIIDPILVYSTYLGGNGSDSSYAIAVDTAGNAYVTGRTSSTNFPLANAIQNTFGGIGDAFITKINAAGNQLVYSTYLGGNNYDYGNAIAVDTAGNAYVTGECDG